MYVIDEMKTVDFERSRLPNRHWWKGQGLLAQPVCGTILGGKRLKLVCAAVAPLWKKKKEQKKKKLWFFSFCSSTHTHSYSPGRFIDSDALQLWFQF